MVHHYSAHFLFFFHIICLYFIVSVLSRYLRAVKLPPQNPAGAKKLGGGSTARKRPIGAG
ncbi:hypothetical protein FT637_14765 [Bacillus cereus]|nr:hypothetical protein [Bacillus cereus]